LTLRLEPVTVDAANASHESLVINQEADFEEMLA